MHPALTTIRRLTTAALTAAAVGAAALTGHLALDRAAATGSPNGSSTGATSGAPDGSSAGAFPEGRSLRGGRFGQVPSVQGSAGGSGPFTGTRGS